MKHVPNEFDEDGFARGGVGAGLGRRGHHQFIFHACGVDPFWGRENRGTCCATAEWGDRDKMGSNGGAGGVTRRWQ